MGKAYGFKFLKAELIIKTKMCVTGTLLNLKMPLMNSVKFVRIEPNFRLRLHCCCIA